MSDPRHSHDFDPNRRGMCKQIIGSEICGKGEYYEPHVRAKNHKAEMTVTLSDAARTKIKSILNGETYDYCQCGNLDVDELAGILGFTRDKKGDWQ